jgi:hypothetical protein
MRPSGLGVVMPGNAPVRQARKSAGAFVKAASTTPTHFIAVPALEVVRRQAAL